MNFNDETLMAFADGELEPAQKARVEAALQADAGLRQRVTALQLQRKRVAAAFDTVLGEPVPDRLSRLLQTTPKAPATPPPTAVVIPLDKVRAERARMRNLPSWAQWGGMAASVLLGVWMGTQMGDNGTDSDLALEQGRLVAHGTIANALTTQLASTPQPGAGVAVQLSFIDKNGAYCRTFSAPSVAGLACQHQGQWAVQQLAAIDGQPGGEFRQAATPLPHAVLDAVDQRMVGNALDAQAEKAARDRGWRR